MFQRASVPRGRSAGWRRRPHSIDQQLPPPADDRVFALVPPPRVRAPRSVPGPYAVPAVPSSGAHAASSDETTDAAGPLPSSGPPKLGQLPKDSPTQLRKEKRRSTASSTSSTASSSSSEIAAAPDSAQPPPPTGRKQPTNGSTPSQQRKGASSNGGAIKKGNGSSSSGGGGGGGGGGGTGNDGSSNGTTCSSSSSSSSSSSANQLASALAAKKPNRPWWGDEPSLETRIPALLQSGKLESVTQARQLLKTRAEEDAPITQFYLGVASGILDGEASACGHYERALKQLPLLHAARNNLIRGLMKRGTPADHKQALDHAQLSAGLQPEVAEMQYQLGVVQMQQNMPGPVRSPHPPARRPPPAGPPLPQPAAP